MEVQGNKMKTTLIIILVFCLKIGVAQNLSTPLLMDNIQNSIQQEKIKKIKKITIVSYCTVISSIIAYDYYFNNAEHTNKAIFCFSVCAVFVIDFNKEQNINEYIIK
jgi:hypothetical protein